MSEFFPDVPKIPFGGPKSRNPLEFKHYNPDEVIDGKTMKEHLRFSVVYWHTFCNPLVRPVRRRDGAPALGRRHRLGRQRPAPGEGRLRVLREARRAVLRLPRPRRRPRRPDPQGEPRQPRRGRQGPQGRAGPHRRQAALGHRQPVHQPSLHARRGHQPELRRLRLRRGPGQEGHGGDPGARRRGLHLLGRPRRLLDPAQHRHEARARPPRPLPPHGRRLQEADRLQRPVLHRAQAQGADQAPVRLRRRRLPQLPADLRPAAPLQAQPRDQPRHPRRPRDDARAGGRHRRRAPRLDRRQHRRLPARLGHRPVPHRAST